MNARASVVPISDRGREEEREYEGGATAPVAMMPLFSLASAANEFKNHLPIWFAYASAVGLLHAALANFPTEGFERIGHTPAEFVPTLLFPLSWFVAYFVLRIRNSQRLKTPWKAYLALAVLTLGVPLAIIFGYQRYPLTHDQLTTLFETTQFFWVGLFVAQILWARGWKWLLLFFGVVFVYGLLLENSGIIMRFFYEPSFRLYLGPLPAPLCTMLGWSLVFYVVWASIDRMGSYWPKLGASVWGRAFAATAMALCLDAQLDPLASMSGVFWRWNELLPQAFLGVPFINFAAWTGAFLPFSYMLFKILDREDLTLLQKNWEVFLRVPLATLWGGVVCFGLMAIWEGGFSGPSFQILADFSERLLPY